MSLLENAKKAIQIALKDYLSGEEGLRCNECGSELLTPFEVAAHCEDVEIRCKSCGEIEGFENYCVRALEDHFSWDTYLSFTDGAEPVLITCPECSKNGYIVEENRCAVCGI